MSRYSGLDAPRAQSPCGTSPRRGARVEGVGRPAGSVQVEDLELTERDLGHRAHAERRGHDPGCQGERASCGRPAARARCVIVTGIQWPSAPLGLPSKGRRRCRRRHGHADVGHAARLLEPPSPPIPRDAARHRHPPTARSRRRLHPGGWCRWEATTSPAPEVRSGHQIARSWREEPRFERRRPGRGRTPVPAPRRPESASIGRSARGQGHPVESRLLQDVGRGGWARRDRDAQGRNRFRDPARMSSKRGDPIRSRPEGEFQGIEPERGPQPPGAHLAVVLIARGTPGRCARRRTGRAARSCTRRRRLPRPVAERVHERDVVRRPDRTWAVGAGFDRLTRPSPRAPCRRTRRRSVHRRSRVRRTGRPRWRPRPAGPP